MKKFLLLFLFVVISCAPVQTEKKIYFSKDLTFETADKAESSKILLPLPLIIVEDIISPVGTRLIWISVFKFEFRFLGLFQFAMTCFLMT